MRHRLQGLNHRQVVCSADDGELPVGHGIRIPCQRGRAVQLVEEAGDAAVKGRTGKARRAVR